MIHIHVALYETFDHLATCATHVLTQANTGPPHTYLDASIFQDSDVQKALPQLVRPGCVIPFRILLCNPCNAPLDKLVSWEVEHRGERAFFFFRFGDAGSVALLAIAAIASSDMLSAPDSIRKATASSWL